MIDRAASEPEGLLPVKEYKTSRGLKFSTCWPVGSQGYCLERQFAQCVDIYQDLGFGRMKQMIQEMWDAVEAKEAADG